VLTQEAENLNQRIEELKSQLATQAQELADRVRERDELRLAFQAARAVETDLRSELSSLDRRRDAATETMRAEKAQLESQLARIREERASLQREVGAMKREAESSWGAERVENAMLRERINDVAAEVVRLTAALEGPSSPIEAILAEGEAPPLNGADAPADAGKPKLDKSNVSLAERIRALQARAGRLSPAAS
jgi:chromosome segregation ATPase